MSKQLIDRRTDRRPVNSMIRLYRIRFGRGRLMVAAGFFCVLLAAPAESQVSGTDFAKAALDAQARGQHEMAVDFFGRAIESEDLRTKDMPKAHNNLGVSYFALGDINEALEQFNRAIELDGTYNIAYRNRGAAYSHLGQYDRAVDDFGRAIDLDPEDPSAFNNRGIAFKHKRAYYKAFSDFGAAIFLSPDFSEAFFNRGKTYLEWQQYDLAIADFDDAIRLNAEDAAAFKYRGVAYERKGQLDWATQDFIRAYDLGERPDWLVRQLEAGGQLPSQ